MSLFNTRSPRAILLVPCLLTACGEGTLFGGTTDEPTRQVASGWLLDWNEWFPWDRGQGHGERAVAIWNSAPHQRMGGHSVFRFPLRRTASGVSTNAPNDTLPTHHTDGSVVDYYRVHGCPPTATTPAHCGIGHDDYSEVQSISADHLELETWGHGPARYFSSAHRVEVCTQPWRFPDSAPETFLRPEMREPLRWSLPAQAGQTWTSPVNCSVVFDFRRADWATAPKPRERRFLLIHNLARYTDATGEIVKAINFYYGEVMPADPRKTKAGGRCMNALPPHALYPDGSPRAPLRATHQGVAGCLVMVEEYGMRRIDRSSAATKLQNGFGYTRISVANYHTWALETWPVSWNTRWNPQTRGAYTLERCHVDGTSRLVCQPR